MNERLKQIRTHTSIALSQEAFAKRLGLTGANISYIESGKTQITEQFKIALCLVYHINRNWLETGDGDMFEYPSGITLDEWKKDKEISSKEMELIEIYLSIDSDERKKLIMKLQEFANE